MYYMTYLPISLATSPLSCVLLGFFLLHVLVLTFFRFLWFKVADTVVVSQVSPKAFRITETISHYITARMSVSFSTIY